MTKFGGCIPEIEFAISRFFDQKKEHPPLNQNLLYKSKLRRF